MQTEGEEEGKGEGEEGQTMEESEKLTHHSGWPRLLSLHKHSGISQHSLGF